MDSIPGSGRFPGGGNSSPLQYSCLEKSMDQRAWEAIVHRSQRVGHDWAACTSFVFTHIFTIPGTAYSFVFSQIVFWFYFPSAWRISYFWLVQVYKWWILSTVTSLRKSSLHLHFWGIFLLDIWFMVYVFPFALGTLSCLVFWPDSFCLKVCFDPVCNLSFYLLAPF